MAKDANGVIVDEFTDTPNSTDSDASATNNADNDGSGAINGYPTIDAAGTGSGGSGSGGTGRRRGRPPGSKNGTRTQTAKTQSNLGAIENILLSIHFFGAALMSTPELELNDDEVKKFAGSLQRVSGLYNDAINPKVVAWVDLLAVVGSIYGPRAIAINARLKAEKDARPAPMRPPVVNIRDAKPQANAAPQNTPRSPVEMFGDLWSGASIPDAV